MFFRREMLNAFIHYPLGSAEIDAATIKGSQWGHHWGLGACMLTGQVRIIRRRPILGSKQRKYEQYACALGGTIGGNQID